MVYIYCPKCNGLSVGTRREPPPKGEGEDVTAMVISDLAARKDVGTKKYGTCLRTHNGRNALVDAYQEALDLALYLRQAIQEQSH